MQTALELYHYLEYVVLRGYSKKIDLSINALRAKLE